MSQVKSCIFEFDDCSVRWERLVEPVLVGDPHANIGQSRHTWKARVTFYCPATINLTSDLAGKWVAWTSTGWRPCPTNAAGLRLRAIDQLRKRAADPPA